jgi:calcium/calmodulin-dependent protein kinase (CaM kinase) II
LQCIPPHITISHITSTSTSPSGCDENMTCFEPETDGNLARGLPFHKYYFPATPDALSAINSNTTIVDPSVRILAGGQSAVVAYTRMVQKPGGVTTCASETRVFEKQDGKWMCVHAHRSPLPARK